MIAVIDYGMGNLRSVQKALEVAGAIGPKVTSSPKDLRRASKIVLPGVGSFGEAIRELKRLRLVEPIRGAIDKGKIFLGLCLGLQLLFERSEEAPGVRGLSILKGSVKRFAFTNDERPFDKLRVVPSKVEGRRETSDELKVPHMGWNTIAQSAKRKAQSAKILNGVRDGAYMYFVHSYYVKPEDRDIILTTTDYGIEFVSGIQKDNIYAFQFHPEKSQAVGLKLLRNFVGL